MAALKFKNLKVEDIPKILNNPGYDSKFHDIKKLGDNGKMD